MVHLYVYNNSQKTIAILCGAATDSIDFRQGERVYQAGFYQELPKSDVCKPCLQQIRLAAETPLGQQYCACGKRLPAALWLHIWQCSCLMIWSRPDCSEACEGWLLQ